MDVYLSPPTEWSAQDKKKLSRAVREDALRKRVRLVSERKDELLRAAREDGINIEQRKLIFQEVPSLMLARVHGILYLAFFPGQRPQRKTRRASQGERRGALPRQVRGVRLAEDVSSNSK